MQRILTESVLVQCIFTECVLVQCILTEYVPVQCILTECVPVQCILSKRVFVADRSRLVVRVQSAGEKHRARLDGQRPCNAIRTHSIVISHRGGRGGLSWVVTEGCGIDATGCNTAVTTTIVIDGDCRVVSRYPLFIRTHLAAELTSLSDVVGGNAELGCAPGTPEAGAVHLFARDHQALCQEHHVVTHNTVLPLHGAPSTPSPPAAAVRYLGYSLIVAALSGGDYVRWCGTVWCGIVWCGTVWCTDIVWCCCHIITVPYCGVRNGCCVALLQQH